MLKKIKIPTLFLYSIFIRSFFITLFFSILVFFIAFARGYRINFENGTVTSTGILSVNSAPKPGKVYIDSEFKGVTDINLTLPNGKYTVEIKKEGYSDYKKNITLKGEIVMSINALLFPKNPSLSPLTNLGILKATPLNGTDKIILFVENNDQEKDGIYLFESTKKTISIFPPLKLIVLKTLLPINVDLKNTDVYFSPDNREAIFTFKTELEEFSYILSLEEQNRNLFDMTESKQTVIMAWQQKKEKDLIKIMETFPKEIRKIASDSFRIISYSPDETKVLYQAKNENSLKPAIPPLIGANQTPQARNLQINKLYVYDRKEDKNFAIDLPTKEIDSSKIPLTNLELIAYDDSVRNSILAYLRWYPDSSHLVIKEENDIDIIGYDGTNRITVYSGPFEKNFFAISPDWNLLILANLNPQNNEFNDIYSIGIR